ncbi:MAG: peptidase M28 [Thermoprotei archaeon]|nr:MAG: peptidase M28 [Thermoprotei archaeon]RLE89647.1 MAG: peptidase M28 [Thermoprotei archaeon]
MYRIGEKELEFLKRLSEAFGPPGFEFEVLKLVKEYVSKYVDNIEMDNLGSLVMIKKGVSSKPRVIIAGHSDEVGFIVTGITKEGYIKFIPLGGWWDQVLLGQRVIIKTRKGVIHGVIASKPPHVLKPEERDKVVKIDAMFIDVGATSKEEVEKLGIRIGDPIVPWSPFTISSTGTTVFGKAFDDRIGVFIAVETLRTLYENNIEHPNILMSIATVQEEVGARGAQTVSYVAEPDVAIIAEVDIARVPGVESHEAPTVLGKGPTILTYDASMIPSQKFKEFVIDVAEESKIPYQLSIVPRGGTDAGRFHLYRTGRPSIVIGVPTRYIHSHVGVIHLKDLENAVKLLIEVVKRLDENIVKNLTPL